MRRRETLYFWLLGKGEDDEDDEILSMATYLDNDDC
jgi:hypothetical protein